MTIQTTDYQDQILAYHAGLNNAPDVTAWATDWLAHYITTQLEPAYIASHVDTLTAALKDDATRPVVLQAVATVQADQAAAAGAVSG